MSGIVIISKNSDFSAVLADHAERELGIKAHCVPTPEKAKELEAKLIVAEQALPGTWKAPVMVFSEKPLRLQTMLEKIQAQLAREELPIGDALFSVQQKTITSGAKHISLTDKETQLLLLLLKNKDGVEREKLLKDVWGVTSELESHTLETHIYRLRAKLKEAGVSAIIAASPGRYVLEV
jgi:hypothetical protein